MDAWGQLGIGGILAVLMIREVLQFLGKHPVQRPPVNGHGKAIQWLNGKGVACRGIDENTGHKIEEVHAVLTRTAADGMPLIYRHPDVVRVLDALANTANTQTAILREMQKGLERLEQKQ
jgi:hypothetical protein